MKAFVTRAGLALLVTAVSAGWAVAQTSLISPSPGTVSGSGNVTLKRAPEKMRLFLNLTAKGKTLDDALAKLKERRAAAEKKLVELGAEKKSISIEGPHIQPVDTNRQQQMERMVRQRMRGRRGAKPAENTPPITVTSALTAEFPLKAEGAEALLMASHAIQEQIRKADLAGLKEKDDLSPEDEELAEEMAEMNSYGTNNESQPGEPNFLFIATISTDERAKARSEAFTKAKAQAEQLSEAAGVKLGPLRGLSTNNTPGYRGGWEEYGSYQMQNVAWRNYVQGAMLNTGQEADAALDAIGPQPDEVSLSVGISAEFELK